MLYADGGLFNGGHQAFMIINLFLNVFANKTGAS